MKPKVKRGLPVVSKLRRIAGLLERDKLEVTFKELIPSVWISLDGKRAFVIYDASDLRENIVIEETSLQNEIV
jgi:hypothetical protein